MVVHLPDTHLSIRPIDSERVLEHFDELFGGKKTMPTKEVIEKHRDSILKALLAQEIYQFAIDPTLHQVLVGDNGFISPWTRYDKTKLH